MEQLLDSEEKTKVFQKEAHHFYSSVLWLHPGHVNPVSHPHQIMHTHAPEKKNKKKGKEERKKTYKCKILCKIFISLISKQSLLRVWKREGTLTDISLKTVTEDVSR